MTTPAQRRARVRRSSRVCVTAAELADNHGLVLQQVTPSYYRIFFYRDSPWGLIVEPGKQEIRPAWGTPPKLELPEVWSILSVVLRVIEALERKESEA